MVSSSDPTPNSSGSSVALGRPANIITANTISLYPQQQPNTSVPGTFQLSQPMVSTTPIWPSQGQLPQPPGLPSVPGNQSHPPQNMSAPGAFPGAPAGSPWPMSGQFPQHTGMQPAGAASPIQQQAHQTSTASPAVSSAPYAMYATSPPSQPAWAVPASFSPQPGQQSPSGTATSSPSQGQAGMYGMPPWAMAGLPPMPMSPQMTGSQLTDPSYALQAAMYQQYMQAAPWQFGPGGVPGWPPMPAWPPWMYSVYPNAHPGVPTSPTVPPANVSPTSQSPQSSLSPGALPGPGPSAVPPPYTEPQRSNESEDSSTSKAQRSSDVVGQGDASVFHVLALSSLVLLEQSVQGCRRCRCECSLTFKNIEFTSGLNL
jgi:hypothetical protein